MTKTAEKKTTEGRTVEVVQRELEEARAAEQRLVEEEAEIRQQQEEALEDSEALEEAALSGKALSRNAKFKKNLERQAELPALQHAIRSRVLRLQVELAQAELPSAEEEAREASQKFYELDEQLQKLREERDWQQSTSVALSEDVKDRRRQIAEAQNRLAQHQSEKVAATPFEAMLNEHRVWRWGPE